MILHQPNALMLSGEEDGYARFVAWARASFAEDTSNIDDVSSFMWRGGSRLVTIPLNPINVMWGSPWGGAPSYGVFTEDSKISRITQHSFEDAAAYNENKGRLVVYYGGASYGIEDVTTGQTRNGYSSSSYSAFPIDYGPSLDYFDSRYPGMIRRSNPYNRSITSSALPA